MSRATKLVLSSSVRDALKYYVYAYLDPADNKPFYIGKGRGSRVLSHLRGRDPRKARILRQLHRDGKQPRIEVLRYGLTEKEALLIEAAAIDLLGMTILTNRVRGHGVRSGARARIEEIIAQHDARPADIKDPMILITINRLFREDMAPQELYDATRSAWKINPRRKKQPRFAAAVYRGVIREVYEIVAWFPAGATLITTAQIRAHRQDRRRMEFVGRLADEPIRRRYRNRSVANYVKSGAQNPIHYIGC